MMKKNAQITDYLKSLTSLGIGITNACNLNCEHCYSRLMPKDSISVDDIDKLLLLTPNLREVNLGTGESLMNQQFILIVKKLRASNIKVALTSNGYSINRLSDDDLSLLSEVDISIDFPIAKLHDEFRGMAGTFKNAINSIKRLKRLGIEVSIATALMNTNYKYIPEFRVVAKKLGVPLRLNIYKSVNTDRFEMTYEEFWIAMSTLSKNFKLIACSEPILSIITKVFQDGSPCGKSLRLHPNKVFTACAYLDGNHVSVETFKKNAEVVPKFCSGCTYRLSCKGGCVSRRILGHDKLCPDKYCPFYNNKSIPKIKFVYKREASKQYIHSSYLCTIITEPK